MPAYRPTPLLASAGMRTPLPAIQIEHLPYVSRLQARDITDIDLVVIHCTELPDMAMAREYGERVLYPQAGTGAAVVESVKAASDVYSPVTGTVVAVNSDLADKPETINEDAFGEGWIFAVEIEDSEQLNELLDPDDYASLLDDAD